MFPTKSMCSDNFQIKFKYIYLYFNKYLFNEKY